MDLEKEKKLAELLVKNNIITVTQAQQCLSLLMQSDGTQSVSFVSLLVSRRYLSPQQLAPFLSQLNANSQTSPGAQTGYNNQLKNTAKLQLGQHFHRYQIEKELGRGGMGAVYKAHDTKLNREVALKVILAGDDVSEIQVGRFMQEAQSMAQFRHPNIIEIYEVGEAPQNYFTMEYIEGQSLGEYIKNDSDKLKPKQIARIIKQCAEALAEVHQREIVHRDIKPGNIMLTKQKLPKLMDFGLAKVMDSDLSRTGEVLGTPAYMSPEQTKGLQVSYPSDIYALGATLYEMLCKRPPFQGSTFANIVCQIMESDPIAPRLLDPDIPADLEAITLKCVEKDPTKRYKRAKNLAQDLDNFIHNRPIMAKPVTQLTHFKKWLGRNKVIVAISFSALIVIVISIAFAIFSLRKQAAVEKQAAQKARKAEEIAQTSKNKALKAQKQAVVERDKAVQANEELKLEKIKTENAYKQIKQEKKEAEKQRDLAKKAINKAVSSLYHMHITLAQNYCNEGKIKEAQRLLNLCPKNLRNWEWHWLKQRTNQQFAILHNKSAVADCGISVDGKTLVAGGTGGKIVFWDLVKQTKIKTLRHKMFIVSCSYSPNRSQIAALSKNGTLFIMKANGQIVHRLPHVNKGTHCTFSPDGKNILCSYSARDEPDFTEKQQRSNTSQEYINLILWDATSGKKIRATRAHKAPFLNDVFWCEFSSDGKWIATAGEDKTVRVYQAKTGRIIRILKGHKERVFCCRFSPDNKKLLSASYDKTMILWDIKRKKKLHTFDNGLQKIKRCAFAPNGKFVISGDLYGVVKLWDAISGKKLRTFYGHSTTIQFCQFLPDSNTIVTTCHDKTIRIWKVDQPHKPLQFAPNKDTIFCTFSPDGKVIAPLGGPYIKLDYYSSQTGQKVSPQSIVFGGITGCSFSPDGKHIALCSAVSFSFSRVYNVEKREPVLEFANIRNKLNYCTYSPNGKYIATGGRGHQVRVWDAEPVFKPKDTWKPSITGKKIKLIQRSVCLRFKGHKKSIVHLDFNPQSTHLAGASEEEEIFIWKIAGIKKQKRSHKPVRTLKDSNPLYCCAYNSDGSQLVAAGSGRDLHLYDTKTGKKLKTFGYHDESIKTCLFTPDNQRIISASFDKTIKIWDTNGFGVPKNGVPHVSSPLLTLTGHKARIFAMALSKDGKILATGDEEGVVKVWNIGAK